MPQVAAVMRYAVFIDAEEEAMVTSLDALQLPRT